jgi:hypothetical protein
MAIFFKEKNVIEHKMCILQILFETFLILRKNERDMTENVCWYSVKYLLLFLSDFNEN